MENYIGYISLEFSENVTNFIGEDSAPVDHQINFMRGIVMKRKELPGLNKVLLRLVLRRLFLPLLVVWIAAIGAAGFLLLQSLNYQQQQTVKSIAKMVDRHLDQGTRILDAVARVAETKATADMTAYMQSTWAAYKHFDTIYYLNRNYKIVLMVPSEPTYLGLDMSNLPAFQKIGEKNSINISRPFISLRTGNPTVYLIRPLAQGGWVIGELNLGVLQGEIAGERGAVGGESVYILDQSGMLLAHPVSALVKQRTNLSYLEIFRRGLAGDTNLVYDYAGTHYFGNSTRVSRVGWVIVDQIPLSTLLGPYALAFGMTILVTLGIWLTLMWNLRKELQRNVVAPLVKLSQNADALAIGDRSRVNVLASASTVFAELNELAYDFQRMSDILEIRQDALRESEERYRGLFERVPTGLFRFMVDGQILDANQTYIQMFRLPDRESLQGINAFRLFLSSVERERWQALVELEKVEYFETRMRRCDESIIWVRIRCRAVRNEENRILYYDGSMEDITDSKRGEEELYKAYCEMERRVQERTADLAKANKLLQDEIGERKHVEEVLRAERSLFMGGPTIVFLWENAEGWPVEYVSPNVYQILGYKEEDFISGKVNYKSIVHPDDFEWVLAEVFMHTKKQTAFFEQIYRIITASGETRWFMDFTVVKRNLSGEVTHYHGYINDITDRKLIEAKMAQLDRLNAIGEVAAGIGHEVRNPMTTVRGYLQLYQKKEEFADYYDHFGTMIGELDRANSIITEFLSLAKNKSLEKRQGNLNNVIQALFPILQAETFQKGHQLQAQSGEIPDSVFDEKEIRQLIINMVRNGLEAMEGSGLVTISTYFENDNIILAIQDTGSGIPAEVLDKLGTPFVTTKDHGTGLGLSICYRIAARHGAGIEVHTGTAGTTFTIIFYPQRQLS